MFCLENGKRNNKRSQDCLAEETQETHRKATHQNFVTNTHLRASKLLVDRQKLSHPRIPQRLRYYLDAALMFARALRLDVKIKPELDECGLAWPGPGSWMDLDLDLDLGAMLDPRLGTAHPQEGQEAAEGKRGGM